MQLFISYARTDRPKVDPLSQSLRQAGNDVWLDVELAGGQVWWDNILYQIRQSDAFIAVVSRSSLRSQACLTERQYAMRLGKPILPLSVEPLNAGILPSDISRLEIVDYSQPDEFTAFRLIGAIAQLPAAPPLPVPLPKPPDAPSSYWGNVGDQVNALTLDLDQQLAIIGRIESAFAPTADPAERPIALDLLTQMERRTDLYAAVDRRIVLLKSSTSDSAGAASPAPKPDSGRGTGSGQGAGTASAGPSAGTAAGTWGNQGSTQAPPHPPVSASPHWILAILALVFFWPTGIPALVYASRVKPRLAVNDLAAARRSSSRVVLFFFISFALLVLIILISVGASNSDSGGAAALGSQVVAVRG